MNIKRYTYRVLQTIQMKLILLCVWAEQAALSSAKTALKFKFLSDSNLLFEQALILAQLASKWVFEGWLMICTKLYIPSTLNIDLILWHTQLIVCAENVISWF